MNQQIADLFLAASVLLLIIAAFLLFRSKEFRGFVSEIKKEKEIHAASFRTADTYTLEMLLNDKFNLSEVEQEFSIKKQTTQQKISIDAMLLEQICFEFEKNYNKKISSPSVSVFKMLRDEPYTESANTVRTSIKLPFACPA